MKEILKDQTGDYEHIHANKVGVFCFFSSRKKHTCPSPRLRETGRINEILMALTCKKGGTADGKGEYRQQDRI